jgi:hypothetical protein
MSKKLFCQLPRDGACPQGIGYDNGVRKPGMYRWVSREFPGEARLQHGDQR